ncbi:MAG: hypothetical protein VXY93_22220, partial [Pseudomonadota bacterium]|nr:hypothetical protein [Pseudomonadota bacterium]
LRIGADEDLKIDHNGSNAYFMNGTGSTLNRAATHIFENANGSTEYLRIKSDGKVGIGTNNPGHQLDGASDLVIGNQGEADSGMTFVSTTNGQSLIHFSDALSGNARYDGFIGYEHTDRFLKFGTAQGLRMVIKGERGRVGINSTDPRGNLDVIESVGTAATIFVNADTHNT